MSASAPAPRFAAWRYRNFRLFWTGNLISLIGSLAQQAAMGWLTRELTADPRLVTLTAACTMLPILFFSLHAGAIADRTDKRVALTWTNTIEALCSLTLGVLVYFNLVQFWHVIIFALAAGVLGAYDIPIRQSFNAEMVEKKDLPSAIALNSTAFNTARVLGPAVGGFLMAQLTIAGCFWANALSFGAIIYALARMRLAPRESTSRAAPALKGVALWRGLLFIRRHPTLRILIILVAVVSFCAMSHGTLLPIFARDVFHTNENGYTVLLTFSGLGALLAAGSLAVSRDMRHKGKRVLLGAFGYCISTIAFSASPVLWMANLSLAVSGFCLLTFLMTANTLVQTLSPDTLRGRVFAIYSMALVGTTPVGAIALGFFAKGVGTRAAVAGGSLVAAMFAAWVFLRFKELWKTR